MLDVIYGQPLEILVNATFPKSVKSFNDAAGTFCSEEQWLISIVTVRIKEYKTFFNYEMKLFLK